MARAKHNLYTVFRDAVEVTGRELKKLKLMSKNDPEALDARSANRIATYTTLTIQLSKENRHRMEWAEKCDAQGSETEAELEAKLQELLDKATSHVAIPPGEIN
jgi:hypothetical protein